MRCVGSGGAPRERRLECACLRAFASSGGAVDGGVSDNGGDVPLGKGGSARGDGEDSRDDSIDSIDDDELAYLFSGQVNALNSIKLQRQAARNNVADDDVDDVEDVDVDSERMRSVDGCGDDHGGIYDADSAIDFDCAIDEYPEGDDDLSFPFPQELSSFEPLKSTLVDSREPSSFNQYLKSLVAALIRETGVTQKMVDSNWRRMMEKQNSEKKRFKTMTSLMWTSDDDDEDEDYGGRVNIATNR